MGNFAIILVYVGFGFLIGAGWNAVLYLRNSTAAMRSRMRGILWAGALSFIAALASDALETGTLPPNGAGETLLVLQILLLILCLIVDAMFTLPVIPAIVNLVSLPFLATILWVLHTKSHGEARIINPWVAIHVAATLIAYTVFAFTFVTSTLYLVAERQLKSRQPARWIRNLPSLEILERFRKRSIWVGVVLLLAGIVIGYLAQRYLAGLEGIGSEWRLSATVIRSTIVWFAYLGTGVFGFLPAWRGRRLAWINITAFLILVASFFLNFVADDFHS